MLPLHPPQKTAPKKQPESASEAHRKGAVVNNQSTVVLYATSWCPYCKKVRKLLKDQGVSYFEYDIENSVEGLRKYKELNGKGVPVLSVNGNVIHGYDEKAILAALK